MSDGPQTLTRDDPTSPAAALGRLLGDARVVDLTLLLAEDLPCTWPGHMWYQHKTFSWFCDRPDPAAKVINRSGVAYQTRWLALDEHTGTHLDAPSHFIPPPDVALPHAGPAGSTSVSDVPVTQAMGPALVIDVTGLHGSEPGISPVITPRTVEEWESEHGAVEAGDIVLFHSAWDRHYLRGAAGQAYGWDVLTTGRAPGWPAPDAAAIELLYERGVRCVGTDGLSVGSAQDGGPAHLAGLRRSMVFVEALTGLDELPPRGAFFIMLTLKIEGGTGGPGRAIAVAPPG